VGKRCSFASTATTCAPSVSGSKQRKHVSIAQPEWKSESARSRKQHAPTLLLQFVEYVANEPNGDWEVSQLPPIGQEASPELVPRPPQPASEPPYREQRTRTYIVLFICRTDAAARTPATTATSDTRLARHHRESDAPPEDGPGILGCVFWIAVCVVVCFRWREGVGRRKGPARARWTCRAPCCRCPATTCACPVVYYVGSRQLGGTHGLVVVGQV
jgi:hypothetical protein